MIILIDSFQNIRPDFYSYSIGLLSLSTILREKGYEVEIINFEYLYNMELISYNFDATKNFLSMAEYIMNKKPEIVGFTSVCNSFHNSLWLSRLLKERASGIKIMFGGPHVSILPQKVMEEYWWIDLICIGEGENKIVEIVKGLMENKLETVPGIVYRDGEAIVRNKEQEMIINLDELPLLNYELVPYFRKSSYITVEIGRGCPYNCIYCSTSRYWKHKFRIKSIERILKEISVIKSILGEVKFAFEFIHDNFTTDYNFTMDLCKGLQEFDIQWSCGARIDTLDEKLIRQMALAGCNDIYIGIESGSPRMQKYIKKNIDLTRVEDVIDIILKNHINPTVAFMYGFPTETEEDLNLTLNLLYSLMKKGVGSCHFTSLCILSGTKLFEEFSDKLVLRDYYSGLVNSPSNFGIFSTFINKNKEFFSHFYILEGSLTDTYFLLDKFIDYIFILLYQFFPRTINLIVKRSENNILNFYNDFLVNSDNRFVDFFKDREYTRDFIKSSEIIHCMITFLEGYINKKSIVPEFRIIFNTFESENTKFQLKYCLPVSRIINLNYEVKIGQNI